MSTYTQILYQLVISTKDREKTLTYNERENLYRYIWGILKEQKCYLYRIGGVSDHIHIITHVHPTVAPAQLIKDIKLSTSKFITREKLFPIFRGWQQGYGAFTYSIGAKDNLIEYVKGQEKHNEGISFIDEYKVLLKEHNVEFDEKYLL